MCNTDRETARMIAIRATELVLRLGRDPYVENPPAHLRLSPIAGRDFDMLGVNNFIVGPGSGSGIYHVSSSMTCLGRAVSSACQVTIADGDAFSVDVNAFVDGNPLSRRSFRVFPNEKPDEIVLKLWGAETSHGHTALLSR